VSIHQHLSVQKAFSTIGAAPSASVAAREGGE
jgi:hypothetical protein